MSNNSYASLAFDTQNFFSSAFLSMTFDDNFNADLENDASLFIETKSTPQKVQANTAFYSAAAPEPYHWAGGFLALGLGWKLQQYKKKLKIGVNSQSGK